MEQKLKKIFSNVLRIELNDINNETSPQTIASWDSINHLSLISGAEDVFNIEIEPEEIVSMHKNFGEFKSVIEKKIHDHAN